MKKNKPLHGIRVLDLSRVLAGPWSSQLLADMGAEVIKVERPFVGDDTRHWGPPWMRNDDGEETGESAYFLSANRGKKSICVDITTEQGQIVIRELAVQSDIFIENFKVGGLAKYQLDYSSLKLINPRLIYCSITGFGQSGPMNHMAGYDFIIQAMGGLMSITGEEDSQLGGGPQKVGVAVADVFSGLYATIGIQSALIERMNSGEGQHIDLALLDVQIAALANQSMNFLIGGQTPKRLGNAHPNIVPYQTFSTSDGFVVLAIGNDRQFVRFCELAGRPELSSDKRFISNSLRVENRQILVPIVSEIMKLHSSKHWLEAFAQHGIPSAPVNDIQQVFSDKQVQARKMQRTMKHSLNEQLPQVANPIRFSQTPIEYNLPPPLLGEHTTEVLRDVLGYSDEQIATILSFKGKSNEK